MPGYFGWLSGLFIFRSFPWGYLSSADYTDGLVFLAWVLPGVYHEQDVRSNCSYCPPSFFQRVGVRFGDVVRVIEDLDCLFKGDVV